MRVDVLWVICPAVTTGTPRVRQPGDPRLVPRARLACIFTLQPSPPAPSREAGHGDRSLNDLMVFRTGHF